jgi:hypothetical protein
MTEQQKVRDYARVDRPYESVREAFHRLAHANSDAEPAHFQSICDEANRAGLPPTTRVTLAWEAAGSSGPVPVSSAEIYASALSPSETQLEIEGHCPARPGSRCDGGGDRVADVCVHTILESIVERLRHDIDA